MVSFLDIDINIEESVFVYKLFDKIDKFSSFTVRMSHLPSNTPSTISYGSIFSELLRRARGPPTINDF